ncbi:MAG: hypothetical protein ACRELD_09370 [Longimicrobiales bacterium]
MNRYRPRRDSTRTRFLFVLFLLLLGETRPAAAQVPAVSRVGIGYVANAPDLLAGGGAYAIFPLLGGLGVYVDAKFDVDSPGSEDTFTREITREQAEAFGDLTFQVQDSYRSFNAALVRPLSPTFTLYAGAGYAQWSRYYEYRDPSQERGFAGFYWVEEPDEAGSRLNLLGGAFMRISRWIDIQVGLESAPRGFTVGASVPLTL